MEPYLIIQANIFSVIAIQISNVWKYTTEQRLADIDDNGHGCNVNNECFRHVNDNSLCVNRTPLTTQRVTTCVWTTPIWLDNNWNMANPSYVGCLCVFLILLRMCLFRCWVQWYWIDGFYLLFTRRFVF